MASKVGRNLLMENYIEAAGMLLFTRTTPPKFLLMQHHNRWDLPKGHAEPDETIMETALRETQEETGISRKKIEIDQDFNYTTTYVVQGKSRGTYHKRVTYFIGYVAEECAIVLTEHIGYRWWDWPPYESIQTQTIDGLLQAARVHFEKFPKRLEFA
jgi:bis(5'-nucleosidyl)-tetraphosphatase